MHLVYNHPRPSTIFRKLFFPIFPGCYSRPKRNRRQWLCQFLEVNKETLKVNFNKLRPENVLPSEQGTFGNVRLCLNLIRSF